MRGTHLIQPFSNRTEILRPNGIIETVSTAGLLGDGSVPAYRLRCGTVDSSTSGRMRLSFCKRFFNLAANRLGAATFAFELPQLIP
jgi:hypothetical protein